MALEAWTYYFGQKAGREQKSICDWLLNAGINTCSVDLNAPHGFGVLVFDEISQNLCTVLRELSRNGLEQVVSTALSEATLAGGKHWKLLEAGAADVISWSDHPQATAKHIAERLKRWSAVEQLLESNLVTNNLIGCSAVWKSVLRRVIEVAHFTDAPVLILGDSGTGKELVARLIHTLDPRTTKRELVVLDCTTIVPELSGSEFFGHERGAFTGAEGLREGAFALADDGTLFLDEVGELPLVLQAQLLRVVQEHSYKRVGGNKWHNTDFRLVCATNKNLREEVSNHRFRPDLYYRIATWVFQLPSLCDRLEDILPLVQHFLKKRRPDKESPELDEPVRDYLLKRTYPGNVRELEQLVLRISHRHVGEGPITIGDIPEDDRPSEAIVDMDWCDARFDQIIRRALVLGAGLKEISQTARDAAIRLAVSDENGNLQRAAHKLGVTDRALQMRRANRRLLNSH